MAACSTARLTAAMRSLVVLASVLFAIPRTDGCTIFVLTNGTRALFCNNEDGANPHTRIWFIPASQRRLGCSFVSSDDGVTQGGFNTAGLACDWVAPFNDPWTADPSLPAVHGSVTQRVLEECRNVEEAITFFQHHNEPSIATGHILLADRTGASVIIGSTASGLRIERARESRGFGFGDATLRRALTKSPAVTVDAGLGILKACRQAGATPTQYATLYDLQSGEIVVCAGLQDEYVTLDLSVELKKGPHYYEIPRLRTELDAPLRPLLGSMERLLLADLQPIPDREPSQRVYFERILRAWGDGAMRREDYTPEFWREISPQEYYEAAGRFGSLRSLVLLRAWEELGRRHYCYRADFAHAIVVEHFAVDRSNRIGLIIGEDWLPEAAYVWESRSGN